MPFERDPNTGLVELTSPEGHIVWNTDRAPVNLLPEDAWIVLPNYQIQFPDFEKRIAYAYSRYGQVGFAQEACQTWITLLPGEWGPGRQHNIPGVVLGTVPQGVNYIDVRVQMSRTSSAPTYAELSVPTLLPTQETLLQGGSCLVESCGGWRRLFEIVLVGQNIVLNRYQSTHQFDWMFWSSNVESTGWTHTGGSGSQNAQAFAARIDIKTGGGAPPTFRRYRGASDQCSVNTNARNFASTYTGTITIRPGYIRD